MGNTEGRNWVFEHVLFLDPNLPPFVTENQATQNQREKDFRTAKARYGNNAHLMSADENHKTVKRVTPCELNLRTRVFRVIVDVDGYSSEFRLKCLRDPLALVLCDEEGNEKRRIPSSLLRFAEKKNETVRCEFDLGPLSNKLKDTQFNATQSFSIQFTFFEENDAQVFSQTLRLLYGISVSEYGISRPDAAYPSGVPSSPFRASFESLGSDGIQENTEEPLVETDSLKVSELIPITISGRLSSGSILRWKDLTTHKKWPAPKVVEWRVPSVPGRISDTHWQELNQKSNVSVVLSDTFTVKSDMTGKYIQVKTIRFIQKKNEDSHVITSIASKGPVTLNDEEARDVLQIITAVNFCITVETDMKSFLRLFENPECRNILQELQLTSLKVSLGVTTKGLSLTTSYFEDNNCIHLPWNTFYVTRLQSETKQYEEDVFLHLYFLRRNNKKSVVRLVFASESYRNSIYNSIFFFKLQKSFRNFDRWGVDLTNGNYSVLQNRYAKLWSSTDFDQDIVNSLVPFETCEDPVELSE